MRRVGQLIGPKELDEAIDLALFLPKGEAVQVMSQEQLQPIPNRWASGEHMALFEKAYARVGERGKEGCVEAYLDYSGVFIRKL